MNIKLAECIGLWLAEGDNKTKSEITFTNNCPDLIKLFYYNCICKYDGRPRIYTYSSSKFAKFKLENCKIKQYRDIRANKPYHILRLASVGAICDWRNTVISALNNSNFYPHILRGFFAGEGSVKFGSHNNRTLLVAQKQPKIFINKILHNLGISHTFSINKRSYVITGKWNWDIFAKYKLADLHPIKKEKFWKIYGEFKEEHYPALQLKNQVLEKLKRQLTARELAEIFNRSQARICDVLMELKKENKIKNFRVGSKDYWTRTNVILISVVKANYLKLLAKGFKRTSDFSNDLNVDWKSANRRLKELEKLGLVKSNNDGWQAIAKTNVRVI
ncbi:MAG: hypothetical protein NTY99_01475 [DPANN group archaeon]|nr:hypothetical protein [DPANN group archaeon]